MAWNVGLGSGEVIPTLKGLLDLVYCNSLYLSTNFIFRDHPSLTESLFPLRHTCMQHNTDALLGGKEKVTITTGKQVTATSWIKPPNREKNKRVLSCTCKCNDIMVGAIQNRDDSGGSPLNISETKPTGLDPRGSETGMGHCDVTSASQRANDLPPLGLSHPTWKMFVMVSEVLLWLWNSTVIV